MRHLSSLALLLALGLAPGCLGDPATPAPGARVAIAVAPLSFPGVTQATYRLEVHNQGGDTVFDRTLDSRGFGAGDGSASYVGPCDAEPGAARNTVSLTLLNLYAGAGGTDLIAASTYLNPGTLTRSFDCLPNADVPVTFDLTVARQANQGFFDVAVSFSDIFCSAKLDCVGQDGAPLALLFDGPTRKRTVVVALACTGDISATGDTWLYHDDVTVTCQGGTAVVDAGAGPGNLAEGQGITSTGAAPLFGAATYRGTEELNFNKRYWNVLLGLEDTATACVVTTRATASPRSLGAGSPYTTPAGSTWPFLTWNVDVTLPGCTTHPVNGAPPHDGVATEYADLDAPEPFARAFGPAAVPSGPDLCTAGQTDCALPSCNAILIEGLGATDGPYAIDPDGPGAGAPAFIAYCDLTSDGGGWTLVSRHAPSGAALNVATAVGTLTAPTQASSAKLADTTLNALRGDLATSLIRSRCGAVTSYFNDPNPFVGDTWTAALTRCAASWDATSWTTAARDHTTIGLSTYLASATCGGYQIWYYTPQATCYAGGNGETWVKGVYEPAAAPVVAAGTSCAAILATTPSATSGVYVIDPDGGGSTAPFGVWCDMTPGDGGWTYGLIVSAATDSASRTRVAGYTTFGTAAGPMLGTEYDRDLTGLSFTAVRIDNFALGTSVRRTLATAKAFGGGSYTSDGGYAAAKIDLDGGAQLRAGYYIAGAQQLIPVCFTTSGTSLGWVCDTDSGPIEGGIDPSGGELCSPSGIGMKVWRDAARTPNPCVPYAGVTPAPVYGLAIR